MNITIDNREHELIKYFPDTETKQLDIGDIVLYNTESKCIIERKTLNDLSSSIIDGRYKEQKQRLLASGHRVVYIIEGITKNKHGVKHSTLLSTMLNMQLRDKITVIRTKDIHETSQIIILLKTKLIEFNNIQLQTTMYNPNIVMKKKHNLTKELIFINQLCCIPGISQKLALCIINKYPKLKDLIDVYNVLDTVEGSKLLSKIDGIGPKISNSVYVHMFHH